jgi:alpha-mannosidase
MAPHPDGSIAAALDHPWGPSHRPDWVQRGLIIWPRGGLRCNLRLRLVCPAAWQAAWQADRQARWAGKVRARLALRWWAEDVTLRVDGATVHRGDLFDTACRWPLPERWWQGQALELELDLVSPLHDDGALIHSHLDLEPLDPQDPLAPGRVPCIGWATPTSIWPGFGQWPTPGAPPSAPLTRCWH